MTVGSQTLTRQKPKGGTVSPHADLLAIVLSAVAAVLVLVILTVVVACVVIK